MLKKIRKFFKKQHFSEQFEESLQEEKKEIKKLEDYLDGVVEFMNNIPENKRESIANKVATIFLILEHATNEKYKRK
jgi:ferritin-like metal-binding protein YciE